MSGMQADDALDLATSSLPTPGSPAASTAVRPEPGECGTLDLLIVLSRRKTIILRTTLAAALLTAIVAFLMPNRYTATASILPPQQSQSLAASMIGQLGAL